MIPGVASFREPAERLISRFTQAWVEDEAVERAARRAGLTALALLGLTVGGVFVTLDRLDRGRHVGLPLLLALAAAVLAVMAARRWRAWRRLDIEDRKLRTVLRLLRILRADIPRDTPVALTADLRDPEALAKRPLAPVTKLQQSWLQVTARLADGNVVTLSLADRIKRKQKRSVRYVCRSRMRVAVHLSRRYRPAAGHARWLHANRRGAGLRVARVEAPSEARLLAVFQSDRVPSRADLPAADELLRALGWLYRGLAPTHPGS